MATQYFFDGQTRTEPGVYSTIKSGNTRGLVNASYNNICIIDTGSAAGFGEICKLEILFSDSPLVV